MFGADGATNTLDLEVGSYAKPIPRRVVSRLGLLDLISALVVVLVLVSVSVLSNSLSSMITG